MKLKQIFSANRILGLILIAVGYFIYALRPLSHCAWYNIFCTAGSLLITPIFVIASMILILIGVYKLIVG